MNKMRAEVAKLVETHPTDTAAFEAVGCILHVTHRPRPSTSQLHHSYPKGLQKLVHGGKVVDPRRVPVCGTGHLDVHEGIRALMKLKTGEWLGGAGWPKGMGRTERELAMYAVQRYENDGGVRPIGREVFDPS